MPEFAGHCAREFVVNRFRSTRSIEAEATRALVCSHARRAIGRYLNRLALYGSRSTVAVSAVTPPVSATQGTAPPVRDFERSSFVGFDPVCGCVETAFGKHRSAITILRQAY